MFSVTRYHDFSAGHVVSGHEGKCAHLHGHNYRVHFTVTSARPVEPPSWLAANVKAVTVGTLDSVGRVIDFSVVKNLLCEWLEDNWDHKFLVWAEDIRAAYLKELDPSGVVLVPFNPTAENMAEYLVNVIGPQQLLGTDVELVSCTIDETRKCSATYLRTR